ncbi:MAG TPA: malate dehydrogenase [bacterium]|nr:malate dehydrogenase [bacterium]
MKKITIIGAGSVGTAAAFYLAEKRVANILMIDIEKGRAKGKALDLMEAAPIRSYDVHVDGSDEFRDMEGSDVIVVAAGVVRKPEMMRLDLLEKNIEVVDGIITQIRKYAPKAFLVVLTEPVDTLVYYFIKKGGFNRRKVMGVSGVLDSTRLRQFIAEEMDVSSVDTTAIVLGGHHDYMVILPRYARVEGIPITELLPPDKVERLVGRTRKAGTEIVQALKTGSACNALGAAVSEIVEAVIRDVRRIVCGPVYLNGEYGQKDICLGVPVMLGKNGVEKVIELDLTLSERESLDKSAAVVRNTVQSLGLEKSKEEG